MFNWLFSKNRKNVGKGLASMAIGLDNEPIAEELGAMRNISKSKIIEEIIYLRIFSIIYAIKVHFGFERMNEANDVLKGFYDNLPVFLTQRFPSFMSSTNNILSSNIESRINLYADKMSKPESRNAESLGCVFADLCGQGNEAEYESAGTSIHSMTIEQTHVLLNKYIEGK